MLAAQYLPGPLWLGSQAQVDSFPIVYPQIREIGVLIIGSSDSLQLSNIDDLSPLAQLKYVDNLYISNNASLQQLSGLENIDTLGVTYLFNNPQLQNLKGFSHVRAGYDLTIRKNDALTNLQGLNNLERLDALVIERCSSLVSLSGLDSFRYSFYPIVIAGNPQLKSISGFPLLDTAGFIIAHNDGLLHFGHFPHLKNFAFNVHDNALLEDFSDLPPFLPGAFIGINAVQNPRLLNFKGFETLDRVSIFTKDNPRLEALTQFDETHFVSAEIQGPAIQKICFPNADTIDRFRVFNCPRLKTLENAIPNADTVGHLYEIFQNDSLYLIREDKGPKRLTQLYIHDNPMLEYIRGFEALEYVRPVYDPTDPGHLTEYGSLRFFSPKFTEIRGFNQLKSLGNLHIAVPDFYDFNTPPDPDIHFQKIEGFQKLEVCDNETLIQAYDSIAVPQALLAFPILRSIHNKLYLCPVKDTLSAFNNLETLGPDGENVKGEVGLLRWNSCKVAPATFGRLKTIKNSFLWNSCLSSNCFRFPELSNCPQTDISIYGTPVDTSLEGIFPQLQLLHGIALDGFDRLHSLHGIEGLETFAATEWAPGSSPGTFIQVNHCDSLSDCSALCFVLEHATFSPPQWHKVSLDNALWPCNTATNLEQWCDTLNAAVEQPLPDEGRHALEIFPNPLTSEGLTFRLVNDADAGSYLVLVTDILGRPVFSGELWFYGQTAQLSCEKWPPGLYSVQLKKNGEHIGQASFIRL